MKIAVKYGTALALGVIAWILISHYVLHPGPESGMAGFTIALFNILPILCIYLGLRERRAANGGSIIFGEGVAVGFSVIMVYVVIAGIFFALMGNRLLPQQGAAGQQMPLWKHFVGFVFTATLGGLFFSAIVSLLMRLRAQSVS
jgi:hypothetical protein